MEDFLQVGVISSTHGIAGELKVYPTTDDIDRFDYLKECIIDTGKEKIPVNVKSVKYFKNMVILKFKEYNNINDVEKFRNAKLLVTRENAVKLEEYEYFICDLIGLKVVTDEGADFGKLVDVLQTGANDVYVVDTGDKEVLLPAIEQCILNVDIDNGIMTVHIMDGLLDL